MHTAILLFTALLATASSLSIAGPDHACQPLNDKPLRIIEQSTQFETTLPSGEAVTIKRHMTQCAKNEGWLQPLIPAPGIVPATELDVLNALNDPDIIVVDMRTMVWYLERTIPGAINIPYTEIAMRLDELGCDRSGDGFRCENAKAILGFCNGPVCPQSPTAMLAMIREGFPAEKIMYYRGGMLDWDALGLTTVEGSL